MPLYIEDNEVHELFGVSQSTMVNTYDKQAKAPVIFRLKNRYNDIKDIPVRVNDVIMPAEVGKAPGKLCCPTTCEWTDERIYFPFNPDSDPVEWEICFDDRDTSMGLCLS